MRAAVRLRLPVGLRPVFRRGFGRRRIGMPVCFHRLGKNGSSPVFNLIVCQLANRLRAIPWQRTFASKLPAGDVVRVFDVNKAATRQLTEELGAEKVQTGATVAEAETAFDAVKDAVSPLLYSPIPT